MLRCAPPHSGSNAETAVLPARCRWRQWVAEGTHKNERKYKMANALGYVSETESGFEGTLTMLNLTASIRVEKNDQKDIDGQPDYRIFAGETASEIGAAWIRQAKATGRDYISMTLADPQIGPRRVYANLAPVRGQDGRHVILWNPS